jgi:hypothetical protein
LFVAGSLLLAASLGHSQPGISPAKLAIVAEQESLRQVGDLLTVELSSKPGLQLLERTEIEKVYHEQELSSANRDVLKLGKILGADGLLLIRHSTEATNQFVEVRLVAVRSGVVVGVVRSPWPVASINEWGKWLVNRFDALFPKLEVAAGQAIPISLVSLRSSIRSAEAQELEQQLLPVLVESLATEPEFFVLERRRMGLLADEKELQGEDSAFWAGSYLLDGLIDPNGYSQDQLTLRARLVPPRGGKPIEFDTRAPRKTAPEAIRQLVKEVKKALEIKSQSPAWSAKREAENFLQESAWALKWGLTQEAKAAADAAWILGKQDLECATMRVRVYIEEAPPDTGGIIAGEIHDREAVASEHLEMGFSNGTVWARQGTTTVYQKPRRPPQPEKIDQAQHLLESYSDISRKLSLQNLEPTNTWYLLGCEALRAASLTLQHFHLMPDFQPRAADKLARLRAECRRLAEWLQQSPAGNDTLWLGVPTTHKELMPERFGGQSIQIGGQSTQISKLTWGFFWQDRPDDALELYRELIKSPVVGKHSIRVLSAPELHLPGLAGWNVEDRNRLAHLWEGFLLEVAQKRREHPDLVIEEFTRAANQPDAILSQNKTAPSVSSSNRSLSQAVAQTSPRPLTPASTAAATNVLVARQFFAVPIERLKTGEENEGITEWSTTGHQFDDRRLWLHARYLHGYTEHYQTSGGWASRYATSNKAVTAVFDLEKKSWEMIKHPDSRNPWIILNAGPGSMTLPRGFLMDRMTPITEFSVVCGEDLFVSGQDYLRRYNLKTKQWETKHAPWEAPPILFVVGQRMLAANSDLICEVLDEQKDFRILASCRRRPSASLLDSYESLQGVQLFAGAKGSLRAVVGKTLFCWDGKAWRLGLAITNCVRAEVVEKGAFLKLGPDLHEPDLWFWPEDRQDPELCMLSTLTRPRGALPRPADFSADKPKPTWTSPEAFSVLSVTPVNIDSNVLILVEHGVRGGADGTAAELDGRHADLLYLERGNPVPLPIPLKFESQAGRFYLQNNRWYFDLPSWDPTWMKVTRDYLWIGQDKAKGVWAIPRSELASAIARAKCNVTHPGNMH